MGAYSPSRLISKNLDEKIIKKIIEPTAKGLREMGTKFKGFLYAGLMIVDNEPYLIEYNVRMGDPECQTILPKLKSDLLEIVIACCSENLSNIEINWFDKKSLCIVLCSRGYPDEYKKNVLINNIDRIELKENEYCYHAGTQKNEFIFHAGTKTINNEVYSNGGRVLNFVVLSNNFRNSKDKAIKLIKKLDWKNGYYRKDIGFKVID